MIKKSILVSLGNLFFRYRSYIPIPIIFLAFYFYYISPINKINPSILNYCLSISLTGLLIRVLVVGYSFDKTSGRNTKSQLASKINKTGIYSLIRHPLYIGNFLIWLGASLITNNLYFVLFSIFFYWLIYIPIILAEEDYLTKKFKNEYKLYSLNVPAIIPNFKKWIKPELNFNLRKVLLNEKNGLLGIFTIFYFFKVLDLYKKNESLFQLDKILLLFVFSLLFYFLIKIYQKINKFYLDTSD